jgi:hypothetical protein
VVVEHELCEFWLRHRAVGLGRRLIGERYTAWMASYYYGAQRARQQLLGAVTGSYSYGRLDLGRSSAGPPYKLPHVCRLRGVYQRVSRAGHAGTH